MSESSSIDFTTYEDQALQQALLKIDRDKYPANFQAAKDEIARRKSLGVWEPVKLSSAGILVGKQDGHDTIVIPAVPSKDLAVFMFIFLIGWAFSDFLLIRSVVSGEILTDKNHRPISNAESVFYVLFWTLVGMIALVRGVWAVGGKEVVLLGPDEITITTKIWHRTLRKRSIRRHDITGLRTVKRERFGSKGVASYHVLRVFFGEDSTDLAIGFPLEIIEKLGAHIVDHARRNGYPEILLEHVNLSWAEN